VRGGYPSQLRLPDSSRTGQRKPSGTEASSKFRYFLNKNDWNSSKIIRGIKFIKTRVEALMSVISISSCFWLSNILAHFSSWLDLLLDLLDSCRWLDFSLSEIRTRIWARFVVSHQYSNRCPTLSKTTKVLPQQSSQHSALLVGDELSCQKGLSSLRLFYFSKRHVFTVTKLTRRWTV